MNQTTNYQLPQWEAGDTVKREDFNDLASRTDAALGDLQTAVAGAASFVLGAYGGNGTYPRDITLGFQPRLVLLMCSDGLTHASSVTYGGIFGSMGNLAGSAIVTETGFRLTAGNTNHSVKTYYYVAFR